MGFNKKSSAPESRAVTISSSPALSDRIIFLVDRALFNSINSKNSFSLGFIGVDSLFATWKRARRSQVYKSHIFGVTLVLPLIEQSFPVKPKRKITYSLLAITPTGHCDRWE
jgi:hypothetical protein